MKRIFLSLTLAAMSVCAVFTSAQAQIKEGAITYSITVEGLPPEQAAMAQGMELKTYFKGGKSRVDMSSAFYNMTMINDGKGNITSLNEMMGEKKFFKSTEADQQKKQKQNKDAEPKITYTEEKKTIAGYECKKALLENKTASGAVTTSEVWFTDKIAPLKSLGKGQNFQGLKGVPLEFSGSQGEGGPVMKFVATNVSTSAVADAKFEVSTEGYQEINPEEMMKAGQGQ